MKQTAVEWLKKEIFKRYKFTFQIYNCQPLEEAIQQAKELEEKQIDEFAIGFAEHIQNIGFNKLTQKGYDNKTVMWFSHKKGIGATTKELLDSYKRNL